MFDHCQVVIAVPREALRRDRVDAAVLHSDLCLRFIVLCVAVIHVVIGKDIRIAERHGARFGLVWKGLGDGGAHLVKDLHCELFARRLVHDQSRQGRGRDRAAARRRRRPPGWRR